MDAIPLPLFLKIAEYLKPLEILNASSTKKLYRDYFKSQIDNNLHWMRFIILVRKVIESKQALRKTIQDIHKSYPEEHKIPEIIKNSKFIIDWIHSWH